VTAAGPTRAWLARRRQRLAYLLVAAAIAATFAAAITGGIRLHHAAVIERQSLRTQKLASAVSELQNFALQAQTAKTVDAGLAARRKRALAAADAAFRSVAANDAAEGRRLRGSYAAYLHDSTRVFERAWQNAGVPSPSQQRRVERRLADLESLIGVEAARQAHEVRVTNPSARFALIAAAVAAALLVALLAWQFELERRAGRLDRDNAERAAELMRLRDEFVAVVSHELRTPLTSIIGYLELIGDDTHSLTEQQRAYLAVVERSAAKLVDLVGDLLLVAAADEGVLALDRQEIDIEVLAHHSIDAARPAADAGEILLTVDHGPTGPVLGDPARLEQMLDNLVSNAVKFTPAGGRVTVRTACRDGVATFEVTDTGDGISVADQEHLFEPFFRTRAASARSVPGTGLGLTITKAIVDAHGGTLEVESAPGAGTTFRVRIPTDLPAPTPGNEPEAEAVERV
jgi:signal transduction histidine kinase